MCYLLMTYERPVLIEIVVPDKLTRAWILIGKHSHAVGFCSQDIGVRFQ